MIRPILNARLDGASTIPATGTLTAASASTVDLSLATVTLPARNIFNISFNGTANVAGDATNTGHFASIPGTGEAGHFVTQNGTAPTLIAGRSAWYSDGSGVPSFKNGTGTAVTLVRSSDLGTGIATFLTTPSSANLAAAVTDETGTGALVFGTSPQISQIEVGHASDTTLARVSAGVLSVEGIRIATIPDMYGEKFAILREEFASGTNSDGSIGELGWRTNNVGGTGGTGTYLVGTNDHPGIFTMTTAAAFVASVPDARGLILAGSAVCPFSSFVAGQEIRVTFQLSSVANVAMKIGLTNDNSVFAPNRGEYLSFDTSLGDTNFMGVTKDGGAETRTSTGVAATTGWFTVKIRYISTSSIGFSLSSAGGAYSSEITVAQTAGATQRFLCIYIANGAAAAKTISVDFVGYYAALTR